jgi:hypothetical protein
MEKQEAPQQAQTLPIDEIEKKMVIPNWRQINIEKKNFARQQLDQIGDTAGFEDNMEATREFEKIIGCPNKSYATYRRSHFFSHCVANNVDRSNA